LKVGARKYFKLKPKNQNCEEKEKLKDEESMDLRDDLLQNAH